ncbi:MAG TPA: PQQ-binding-like beta-propeller repeat protein [Pirellulaceae bacterium]|nr:PQQ-binding-like beta-propeller repeat protein [Pirellulaceae bacterium]
MIRLWHGLERTAFALTVVWTSILALPVPTHAQTKPDPLDWPYWRGPEYNNISRETGLPDTIDPDGGEGSNLLWKKTELGGRSTPIVLSGKLYTILRADPGTPKEGEKVVCVDAATGETIWESRHNVWSSEVPDTRVGWSSVVGDPETGRVYALGACGLFECYEGDTGKIVWSIPMHERFGLLSTYGGRTNFPIIHEDLVILGSVIIGWGDMAVPAHRLIALNKATGDVVWFVSTRLRPPDTIYSAPVLATINGQRLLITGSSDGWVYALQPRTGKIVWEYQFSRRGLNVSPTVDGDIVYTGHSEENPVGTKMGAVAAIKAGLAGNITESGQIWKELEVGVGKSSILKIDDRLYCFDDAGKARVLDAKTGEPINTRPYGLGTINFASPVYAEGKIYHVEKNGRWYILTPDRDDGLARYKRGETMGMFPSGDECWASPVVSHGRLYLLTTGALYCFEDKSKEHGATPRPPQPEETPVAQDEKPAQLQVVPCELLMQPGEKQQLTVRLFNANGQFLKETPAEFAVEGDGAVSPQGEFTASDTGHAATYVTAKAANLTARSRIRVVPPLPWKFDFENLKDPPITWVGARYRHVLRQMDGSNVMVKVSTIPLGTKSRCSMGQSDLSDYTIQADFKAAVANKLPNAGVIAQGYTLEVSGENEWIKLVSWVPHDKRYFKEIPFQLEPNVWYTMKLRATVADGKAVLQGKVWKRDAKEPADWTIELTDPVPNTHGAPGLFGDATNAELYLDNVSVTPNSVN